VEPFEDGDADEGVIAAAAGAGAGNEAEKEPAVDRSGQKIKQE
jgi:hypothetical protein